MKRVIQRLAITFLVSVLLLGLLSSSAFAGEWVWKSAYTYKQSPATGRSMKLVTGVWIYKYYSNYYRSWRFNVGPSEPGRGTYMRFETDGNSIYVEPYNALWRYVGYWLYWTVDWQGPRKSFTSNWVNWQHMGDINKVYKEGNSLRIETYFTINDGRSWKTSVWRDIYLSRGMTSDPWY